MKPPGSDLDAALRASMTVAYYMVDDTVPIQANGRFHALMGHATARPVALVVNPDDLDKIIWAGFSIGLYFVPVKFVDA